MRNNIEFEIITSFNEILKYLHIGTNIPIWPEFYEFILHDLKYFNAKSILQKENGNPIGHSLIFQDEDTLFFGYFGVLNYNEQIISNQINFLLEYAKKENCKLIRGPINIPTIIYGWGFMKEGSKKNLFIGKPINPPIYQKLFLKNGFYINHVEETWEGMFPRFNPWKIKNYNFDDYEYFSPNDWNEILALKNDFLRVHAEVMSPSSITTPRVWDLYENIANFIQRYGDYNMISFVRYKPTQKIVACGTFLPNPFRVDKEGNLDSVVGYIFTVNEKHRRKGLVTLMIGASTINLWRKKIRYSSAPTRSDNIGAKTFLKNIGHNHSRTHIIIDLLIKP